MNGVVRGTNDEGDCIAEQTCMLHSCYFLSGPLVYEFFIVFNLIHIIYFRGLFR
ncbi:hypothetical protein HanRHA438_Chr08g0365951 [Helianthus annuus]|nr:hypothetical protein HanIR_Chr08g0381671 [Helianthus annuus]KAJ0554647.1 hypothetical protein HanHA89_Chr08g0310481 [Helianthus annuus]KAJ0720209.1 hypothetical protein HanLR1_Chr08g0290761 [Helianthus annuus]KAJ0723437.1 hypothetical protein HanOQP8_Chr08g0298261 [Helianthus annuus]KAJ0899221.1 hypothetical protein HanRHA438_Chr08g0365951 [Helianthus annuus]